MGWNLDLTGETFNRLYVFELSHKAVRGRKMWLCLCDCGNTKLAQTYDLTAGNVQSCGCLHRDLIGHRSRTHGATVGGATKTYRIWCGMHSRCANKNATPYKDYGGRGIAVCRRWSKFEKFLADMGQCPPGMTLERRNNDGNYTPKNCRWATQAEQAYNTTRTRRIVFMGDVFVARDLAALHGVGPRTFYSRMHATRGWDLMRACTQPTRGAK